MVVGYGVDHAALVRCRHWGALRCLVALVRLLISQDLEPIPNVDKLDTPAVAQASFVGTQSEERGHMVASWAGDAHQAVTVSAWRRFDPVLPLREASATVSFLLGR